MPGLKRTWIPKHPMRAKVSVGEARLGKASAAAQIARAVKRHLRERDQDVLSGQPSPRLCYLKAEEEGCLQKSQEEAAEAAQGSCRTRHIQGFQEVQEKYQVRGEEEGIQEAVENHLAGQGRRKMK